MSILTVLTVLTVVYGALNARGYARALALAGAAPAGAAIVVGAIAVPVFYAVAVGAAVALVATALGRGTAPPRPRRRLPPGTPLLLLFLGWSFLVTLVAPLLFGGARVQLPSGPAHLVPGVVTSSNVAQVVYLTLGVCVVVFVARSRGAGPELIGLTVGLTVLLSSWRYLHVQGGVPFPEGVFDNSPFFAYVEMASGGTPRFRGILSEPAGLAATCLIAIAYMLPRSYHVTGWRRVGTLTIAGLAGYLGVISTSATFIVAGVAVVLIALTAHGLAFLARRTSMSALIGVVACVLVLVAIWLLPTVSGLVQSTVDQKVNSPSFAQRSGADSGSYELFFDTFGIGAGLGSNRASSFFPGLLSTTGIVGVLLFASLMVLLIRRTVGLLEWRPVIWALVALLVIKVVAGPDLSDTSGVLWMSIGLLSGAAARVTGRGRNDQFEMSPGPADQLPFAPALPRPAVPAPPHPVPTRPGRIPPRRGLRRPGPPTGTGDRPSSG